MTTSINVNKEFIVVFQPKQPELYSNKRRFAIGGKSLAKYIGEYNAEVALERAWNAGEDKYRVKLRKHGIVDFYTK